MSDVVDRVLVALNAHDIERFEAGPFVVQHEEVTGRGAPERHIAVYLRDDLIARERLLA